MKKIGDGNNISHTIYHKFIFYVINQNHTKCNLPLFFLEIKKQKKTWIELKQ